MLDRIDDIDWRRLSHAYGSAADVPDQIRALRSPDRQVREAALDRLYGNIFHQGSRYEASAYAVPFLLELLADPATPDRDALLHLLTSLAIGYDESWLPDGFPVAGYRAAAEGGRELLAAKPSPWVGDDETAGKSVEYEYTQSLSQADQGRLWAYVELAGYDAVRAGVPLFRTLLTDPDQGVRVLAAYALAWFPEDAAGSVPALFAAADAATEPDETATALVAAGLLGTAPDATVLTDPRPVVRWAAAVARARVLGESTDEATVEELLRWTAASPGGPEAPDGAGIGSNAVPDGDETDVPFQEGDLAGYAGAALGRLGPRHADRAFDALLDRLPAVSGEEALRVTTEALRLAFPAGRLPAGTPADALTPRQRRLAGTLARSPQAWLLGGVAFANFSLLVGGYGLPRDRDAMAAYLG